MPLSLWSVVLWVSGFALNLALFAILLYKKRYRTLPMFTTLIGLDALQTIILFLTHRYASQNMYAYAWYSSDAIDAVLHVLVIWEVARILIEHHLGLRLHDEIRSHWIAFLCMGVLSVYFLTYPTNTASHLESIVLRLGQVSTVGVGGLLLMVLGLTFFFRVKVRVHAQAVVYGLALYTFGKFIMQGAVVLLGTDIITESNDWLRPVYHVTLLIWIVCLWRKEPERVFSDKIYTLVRQGRAGINPAVPASFIREQEERRSHLVYSIQEQDEPAKALKREAAG